MATKPKIDFRIMICEFLKGKGKLAGEFFFTTDDGIAVFKWPNSVAKKVWKELTHNIRVVGAKGISELTCPFCIKYKGITCLECEWGQQHGRCPFTKKSDVYKIQKWERFTNKFYLTLINKIEKKYMQEVQ